MTTIVLNTNIGEVENKITCDNVLVEKTNYLTLSQNIRTTSNCNKFTGKILDPRKKKYLINLIFMGLYITLI